MLDWDLLIGCINVFFCNMDFYNNRGFVFVIFKLIEGVKRVIEDSNKFIEVSVLLVYSWFFRFYGRDLFVK